MTAVLKMGQIILSPKTKVIICCGAGGVGKTTTAAAMASTRPSTAGPSPSWTIDPAKRLAQSLG